MDTSQHSIGRGSHCWWLVVLAGRLVSARRLSRRCEGSLGRSVCPSLGWRWLKLVCSDSSPRVGRGCRSARYVFCSCSVVVKTSGLTWNRPRHQPGTADQRQWASSWVEGRIQTPLVQPSHYPCDDAALPSPIHTCDGMCLRCPSPIN